MPTELNECIGNIKNICDINAPALARLYNLGSNIPLMENSGDAYSLALQSVDTDGTMRDMHDLPANDMQPPIRGVGLDDIL